MNKILVIFLSLIMLMSCQRKMGIFSSREEVFSEFQFENLTAKAKINYDDGKRNLSGTANIRARKDSLIWISLSPGLGVEAARILIMKDSIFFIDRINNKYLKADYKELSRIYDFDLNFKIVEAVIIGNLLFPYRRSELVQQENGVSYKQIRENIEINNFIGKESRKLELLGVIDLEHESSISVNYGDFKMLAENAIFPYNIFAIVEYKAKKRQTTRIDINYSKAELPGEIPRFPFNIPDKFKSY